MPGRPVEASSCSRDADFIGSRGVGPVDCRTSANEVSHASLVCQSPHALHMWKSIISPDSPFSLHAVVASHGWVSLAPFEALRGHRGFTYVSRLSSGNVVEIRVTSSKKEILVEASSRLNRTEGGEVKSIVSWMIGLDLRFDDFYRVAASEPRLKHVRRKRKGRLLRSPTLFEDVTKTILTTNTTWTGTKRMVEALVSRYGDDLPGSSDKRSFPEPESMLRGGVKKLTERCGLGYRGPYIYELCRRVVHGDLDLDSLRTYELPTSELRKRLLDIRGVGPYAAATLLMLLGRYDFLPVDSWARKLVSLEWHDGEEVGEKEVLSAFEVWGPWKGLAYWFWDWEHRDGT